MCAVTALFLYAPNVPASENLSNVFNLQNKEFSRFLRLIVTYLLLDKTHNYYNSYFSECAMQLNCFNNKLE